MANSCLSLSQMCESSVGRGLTLATYHTYKRNYFHFK